MITTYATLKTAMASRLNRNDQTTAIEDAVDAATMRLSRDLRVYDQEERSTANLTTEYSALPTDFNGVRSVRSDGELLEYHTPEAFQRYVEEHETPERPVFTIEKQQLRVHPAPTVAAPLAVDILYHARITELVNASDTNWVLDNHPDLYLAASMVELLLHMKDPDGAAVWEARATGAIASIIVSSRRRRYTGGQLVIRRM